MGVLRNCDTGCGDGATKADAIARMDWLIQGKDWEEYPWESEEWYCKDDDNYNNDEEW